MVGLLGSQVGRGIVAVARKGLLDADEASVAEIKATQIRTLGAVLRSTRPRPPTPAHDAKAFNLTVRRLRPAAEVFVAWLALHPLENPHAPPDPSYLPQYRIPQEAQGRVLTAQADHYFEEGQSAAGTADKYVRLTVFLAAVLFLVGIGSRFPVRVARYGLVVVAAVLLVVSVVQLLGLPGPPS